MKYLIFFLLLISVISCSKKKSIDSQNHQTTTTIIRTDTNTGLQSQITVSSELPIVISLDDVKKMFLGNTQILPVNDTGIYQITDYTQYCNLTEVKTKEVVYVRNGFLLNDPNVTTVANRIYGKYSVYDNKPLEITNPEVAIDVSSNINKTITSQQAVNGNDSIKQTESVNINLDLKK